MTIKVCWCLCKARRNWLHLCMCEVLLSVSKQSQIDRMFDGCLLVRGRKSIPRKNTRNQTKVYNLHYVLRGCWYLMLVIQYCICITWALLNRMILYFLLGETLLYVCFYLSCNLLDSIIEHLLEHFLESFCLVNAVQSTSRPIFIFSLVFSKMCQDFLFYFHLNVAFGAFLIIISFHTVFSTIQVAPSPSIPECNGYKDMR